MCVAGPHGSPPGGSSWQCQPTQKAGQCERRRYADPLLAAEIQQEMVGLLGLQLLAGSGEGLARGARQRRQKLQRLVGQDV